MGGSATSRLIRFGLFEVDLRLRELRKQGRRIKLQEQPFQILAMLLEKPGELVTREELRERIWSDDTFVDFDHNLNRAINKIREALSDSAENPRFVQTLPRRGYRFVAPVERAGEEVRTPARKAYLYASILAVGTLLLGAGLYLELSREVMPKAASLAVLPLDNLSNDPEQEYFSEGMTDALISNLGRIRALRVISRTSAMQYKDTDKPAPDIARELDVSHIVEGSILRAGEKVRVTVQLIDAKADAQLWTQSYERDLRDVLSLQREVARAVARAIELEITPDEEARLSAERPVDPEVYTEYLKGRMHLSKRTPEGFRKAAEHFLRVTDRDPQYAPAHAGLADSYHLMIAYGLLRPTEGYPKAEAAATRALEIDGTIAEAHVSLAVGYYKNLFEWEAAEASFRRALELNPSYSIGHHWYGVFLMATGRHEEAIAEMKRAIELDPLSLIFNTDLGSALYFARQYDLAIEQLQKTVEMDRYFFRAHWNLGLAYEAKGMYKEAIAELQQATELSGRAPQTVAALGHAYAKSGQTQEALQLLGELEERSKREYIAAVRLAHIKVGLGDTNQALRLLEKSYRDREPWIGYVKVWPAFDPLRTHPRFQDLLKQMNFPQ
jgi:TolB-like protein/DNA-binding winged helix-turn-helix (wHTH) protein/Tfp pilus assembly protein PilF